jgi:hypothetical protein
MFLILLLGLVGGCLPNTLYSEFEQKYGGSKKVVLDVMQRQAEEYRENGKFISKLSVKSVECYADSWSQLASSKTDITNFLVSSPCGLAVEDAVGRLFAVPNSGSEPIKLIGLYCTGSFKQDALTGIFLSELPQMVNRGLVTCPKELTGKRSLPEYYEYPSPKSLAGQSDIGWIQSEQQIVARLNDIAQKQVDEFKRIGEYTSGITAVENECVRQTSTLLGNGTLVINFVDVNYGIANCKTLEKDRKPEPYTHYMSAVFASEDIQRKTIQLSRVVCKMSDMSAVNSILQDPPTLNDGDLSCSSSSEYVKPDKTGDKEHSTAIEKISSQIYPPVPRSSKSR